MSEKKNIDRLFQEKFKDFEAAPPEFVWENIREELQGKKKRRVVPLWFRLSGVAAALILGLFFLQPYYPGSKSNPVVNGPEAKPGDKINPADNPVKAGQPVINNSEVPGGSHAPVIVYGDGKGKIPRTNPPVTGGVKETGVVPAADKKNAVANRPHDSSPKGYRRNNGLHKTFNEGVAETDVLHKRSKKGGNDTHQVTDGGLSTQANNNAVVGSGASHGRSKKGGDVTHQGAAGGLTTQDNNQAVVGSGASHNNKQTLGEGQNGINHQGNPNGLNTPAGNGVAQATTNTAPGNTGKGTDSSGTPTTADPENGNPAIDINKDIPVNEAVAGIAIDTVKPVPENALEKLLREQQEAKLKDKDKALAENTTTAKWNVKPQLAPVFYNSLSQGSPIDSQFAANSKSYDTNLSYGVGVNYAVNNKFTIRSGINTVNLNYATQGVEFYASLSGQTSNVGAKAKGANIVVKDQGTQTGSGISLTTDNIAQDTFNGSMLQKTGYVEVPVEMAYAVLNKKFGIDIIGGLSTLFLNQNSVSVVSSQGLSTNVGQAQNLNNIHFSTNVGLGFKYRFFKSFEANFEPTFKYQVNTFSRDAGNFKPYFIGLYSGISFSF